MKESKTNPQFTDSNGTPIFVGDKIVIEEIGNGNRMFKNKVATVGFLNKKGKFVFTVDDENPMQFSYDFSTIKKFRKY